MEIYSIHKYLKPVETKNLILKENFQSLFQLISRNQIIYVHAPAGYGKTTSVLLCLKRLNYKAAWFTVDKYDNNLKAFCKGLLFSLANTIQSHDNSYIVKAAGSILTNESSVECVLEILGNIPLNQMPGAIVIDDFHMSQIPEIENALLLIQKRLSRKTLLIIISRKKPSSVFFEAYYKNMFYQITVSDLIFNKKDMEKILLKNNITLADDIIEKIQKATNGWPIAVYCFIFSYLNGKDQYIDNLNILQNKEFYNYLKTKIYGLFDYSIKVFLKKTSITDIVDLRFCKDILNFSDCENVLTVFENDLGLARKIDIYKYKYHQLFKEFLESEFNSDDFIDRNLLYSQSAKWFCTDKQYFTSLEIISKSNDINLLNNIITEIAESNGEINIEEYLLFVKPIIKKIDKDILYKFPNLFIRLAWIYFLSGELKKMKEITYYLYKKIFTDSNLTYDVRPVLLICAIEPNNNSWNLIEIFEKAKIHILDKSTKYLDSLNKFFLNSATHNLPFFHKGQKDYGDIAPFIEEYLVRSRKALSPFLGVYYDFLHILLAAGIFYEKNELDKSFKLLQILQEKKLLNIEIYFCSEILLIEVLFAKGLDNSARFNMNKLNIKLSETKASHLNKNKRAYEIRQMLYNGNKKAAEEWLANIDGETDNSIQFAKCFQNIVTVKALMVCGKFKQAIELSNDIIVFCKRYYRWIDIIEISALTGVCYYKLGKEEKALEYLNESILLAQKYLITTPLILIGKDIIILLQKVLNQINRSSQFIELKKDFILKILISAKKRASLYKGFFINDRNNTKLSPKQTLVLEFLSQGLSYQQISEKINIKINTVRDHIKKLYQKLEVNNSADAVSKAEELGIL